MGFTAASLKLAQRDSINGHRCEREIFVKVTPPGKGSNRKFTEEEVRAIRADPRRDKVVAAELGVTERCIYQIRRGFNYAWVI